MNQNENVQQKINLVCSQNWGNLTKYWSNQRIDRFQLYKTVFIITRCSIFSSTFLGESCRKGNVPIFRVKKWNSALEIQLMVFLYCFYVSVMKKCKVKLNFKFSTSKSIFLWFWCPGVTLPKKGLFDVLNIFHGVFGIVFCYFKWQTTTGLNKDISEGSSVKFVLAMGRKLIW